MGDYKIQLTDAVLHVKNVEVARDEEFRAMVFTRGSELAALVPLEKINYIKRENDEEGA